MGQLCHGKAYKIRVSEKKLKKISQAHGAPEPGSPAFKKLQKQWYDKLRKSGFQDLEAPGTPDGKLSNRGKPTIRDQLHYDSTVTFYTYIDAYLAHYHTVKGRDRYLLKLKQQGKSYREIVRLYEKRYKEPIDLSTAFYKVKELLEKCLKWNKESKYGCLYKDHEDV